MTGVAGLQGRTRWVAGLLGDRSGVAAVEFAIIAAPFLFMIFAVIQLALYFMVQVTLDNAVAIAARQLRTGQIVASGKSDSADKTTLMTLVCSNMSWLQSQCQGGVNSSSGTQYLTIDVQPLGAFANGPSTSPTLNANGTSSTNSCFNSGSAGSAVEFRAYYRWQLLTPILMTSMQTFSNGVSILRSAEIFQVEPNGQSNSSSSC